MCVFQNLNTIYPVVRDQSIFLAEQFYDLDEMLKSKQGIITKYKTLNASHKKLQTEKEELEQ